MAIFSILGGDFPGGGPSGWKFPQARFQIVTHEAILSLKEDDILILT